jgi:hypothetical protein
MSPEQVVGQPADQRSDVFSVGLVLYELVSYHQAFRGDTQEAVLLKVLNESPEPLSSFVPGLDQSLQAIVSRATQKAADARYADLEAMRSDLSRVVQRLLAAESAQADPDRGTPAARGRGRARDPRKSGGKSPATPPAPPARSRPNEPSIDEALAAAERDAYEGRIPAAIRRLEALKTKSPDVDAALARYRLDQARPAAPPPPPDGQAPQDFAELVRSKVVDVRTAVRDGRWGEVRTLLQALERELPPSPTPGSTAPRDLPAVEISREDEVNRYLRQAQQRLEAGDREGAGALIASVLNLTLGQ